jgi:hypothetical protein
MQLTIPKHSFPLIQVMATSKSLGDLSWTLDDSHKTLDVPDDCGDIMCVYLGPNDEPATEVSILKEASHEPGEPPSTEPAGGPVPAPEQPDAGADPGQGSPDPESVGEAEVEQDTAKDASKEVAREVVEPAKDAPKP